MQGAALAQLMFKGPVFSLVFSVLWILPTKMKPIDKVKHDYSSSSMECKVQTVNATGGRVYLYINNRE